MKNNFEFGDIVLLKFPFTNQQKYKKRPALILHDTNDGDVIVCRITSKPYNTIYDVPISDWNKQGLKAPSVIRVHKINSLEKEIVDMVIGKLKEEIIIKVKMVFEGLIELKFE